MKLTLFALRWKSQQLTTRLASLVKVAFFTGNPTRPFLVPNLRLIYSNAQKTCTVLLWSPYLKCRHCVIESDSD